MTIDRRLLFGSKECWSRPMMESRDNAVAAARKTHIYCPLDSKYENTFDSIGIRA